MMSRITLVLLALFSLNVSPAWAETPELEEVIGLLRKTHDDQCQRHALRSKVMVAHRAHDQKSLDDLYPRLESISKKLKSDEDRIKVLQSVIAQNYETQNALEAAQVELGACD